MNSLAEGVVADPLDEDGRRTAVGGLGHERRQLRVFPEERQDDVAVLHGERLEGLGLAGGRHRRARPQVEVHRPAALRP